MSAGKHNRLPRRVTCYGPRPSMPESATTAVIARNSSNVRWIWSCGSRHRWRVRSRSVVSRCSRVLSIDMKNRDQGLWLGELVLVPHLGSRDLHV